MTRKNRKHKERATGKEENTVLCHLDQKMPQKGAQQCCYHPIMVFPQSSEDWIKTPDKLISINFVVIEDD